MVVMYKDKAWKSKWLFLDGYLMAQAAETPSVCGCLKLFLRLCFSSWLLRQPHVCTNVLFSRISIRAAALPGGDGRLCSMCCLRDATATRGLGAFLSIRCQAEESTMASWCAIAAQFLRGIGISNQGWISSLVRRLNSFAAVIAGEALLIVAAGIAGGHGFGGSIRWRALLAVLLSVVAGNVVVVGLAVQRSVERFDKGFVDKLGHTSDHLWRWTIDLVSRRTSTPREIDSLPLCHGPTSD
jgi:hypothetical protein